MGAELFDVKITIGNDEDNLILAYATKVSSKKNKDTNKTLTFDGDVNTTAKNTGGTISIERLSWPASVEEAVRLEELLESDLIKTVTCVGNSYTANGDLYTRQIIGTNVTVTSDEDEWSPDGGVTQKLELTVNRLQRISE